MEYTKEKYKKELDAYRKLFKISESVTEYGKGYLEALEKVENLILLKK